MTLLLDTHVLLWWLNGDYLDPAAGARIADADERVLVSSVSLWEIAIKRAIGKLDVEGSIVGLLADEGFEPLTISWAHAERAGALPRHHRDPFDRMLIAQAQEGALTLVSRDSEFGAYEIDLLAA